MQSFNFGQVIRKFFLSAFVIISFVAYIFEQHLAALRTESASTPVAQDTATAQPTIEVIREQHFASHSHLPAPASTAEAAHNDHATLRPAHNVLPPSDTPEMLPFLTPADLYKDGTYTGPETDAYYGPVQVQVTVQGGKISDVQFLEYPDHRRTSQEINAQAIPWLQQEAIRAQSANVDIISGATLTSEAFVESLQAALQTAQN